MNVIRLAALSLPLLAALASTAQADSSLYSCTDGKGGTAIVAQPTKHGKCEALHHTTPVNHPSNAGSQSAPPAQGNTYSDLVHSNVDAEGKPLQVSKSKRYKKITKEAFQAIYPPK
jgi:hypothetical protein